MIEIEAVEDQEGALGRQRIGRKAIYSKADLRGGSLPSETIART